MKVPPRLVRRTVVDPLFVPLALAGAVVAAVVALAGALATARGRRHRLARVAAFAGLYLVVEATVIVACFGLWLTGTPRRDGSDRRHAALLRATLDVLVGAGGRLADFRTAVREPPPDAVPDRDGPLLVISRHAGVGDSFALIHLLLRRYHWIPRVVLTADLQLDPALDILIHRLGGCFVTRGAPEGAMAARIRAWAGGLSGRDALVLFPEGGNYTPGRRSRALRWLRRSGELERARIAAQLDHVLPPRPGGVLAALAAGAVAGVVVVAHTGLDDLTTAGEVWRALPFASPLWMRWWYVPVADIPDGEAEREHWLTLHWAVVDEWIDVQKSRAAHDGRPAATGGNGP